MADKKFTLVFDATMDVGKVKSSVSEIQKALNSLNMSKGMQSSTASIFKNLMNELDNYNTLTSQAATSMADIKKADKSLQSILNLFDKLNSSIEEVGASPLNFIDSASLKRINAAKKALTGAKEAMSNTAIATKKADLQQQFDKAKKSVDELNRKVDALNSEINNKKTARSGIEENLAKAREEAQKLEKELNNLQSNPIKAKTKTTTKEGIKTTETLNATEVEDYRNKLSETKRELDEVNASITRLNKDLANTNTSKAEEELAEITRQATEATQTMNEFAEKLKHVKKDTKEGALDKLRNELADLTGNAKKDIPQTIDKIEEFIQSLEDVEKVKVGKVLDKMNQELSETGRMGKEAAAGMDRTKNSAEELSRTAQDIDNLKNQVLDFFSISNTIQIFKDAIRDAFETVKELDAAMTETAVVTDFSIGDMWDKLPEYSEQATKLGTSIKSLYEATTLYYQQGLDSEQAMGVGIETMKMARVANMDAAAATEAMTAALRGFNMEINEISATRVSDVYSELAAITAADTSQIATAMSKTASIASSANMEFETTAALLAQIIETTQEAPETAGTAMKTIIARFTEVKQLFDQGLLTGEDSEGEEININKIDAALKTVGISLKDFLTGAKGIDDIFLELASKWDTLDLATQRYIATTAAGSRQQSRFLAMMSNYDRTMELVTAANNSAGASQKQFDKTLESLDAKLQRLRNAWQEFTMGLANSDAIKFAVDALTMLLEAINKLTGLAGNDGFGGIITAVIRLATVIGALKSGEGILNGILKYFKDAGFENIIKIGDKKLDFFGPLLKTTDRAGNDLLGIVEILKDPALRGEAFAMAATKAKGFLAVLGKFAPYIGILLALGAAINLIYNNSLAGQIEAAKQATERASEKAQEAAQEYDILNNSLDSIGRKASTLENMTRGTQEWKNAVSSLNQEILDLVANYPELAPFIVNKGGVLEIDYDTSKNGITAGDVISSHENRKARTQVDYAQRQINQKQLEIESQYRKTIGETFVKALAIDSSWMGSNDDVQRVVDQLSLSLAKGEAKVYNQESLDTWMRLNHFSPDMSFEEFSDFIPQLQEYGNYLMQQGAALDGFTSAIVAAEISLMDFKDIPQDVQESVVNTNSKGLNSIYQKAREKAEKEVDRKTPTREDQEAYARAMGYTISGHGQFTSFYKDGEKQEVRASDVMNFVINDVAGANFSESLTALTETLKGATDNGREMYSAIFGNGVVTSEMLTQYGSVKNGQYQFDRTKMDALAKEMNFGGLADMIAQTGIQDMSFFVQEAFSEGYTEFIAEAMKNSGGGKQNLFKAFSISEEYEEVNTKLKELVETQGEITGADIDSLASEYKSLERLIEDTGVSASAMASIFEDIQNGSLTFDNLTDSLLSAIGTMNVLEEATNRTLKRLKELNLGQDTGEIKDIYGNFAGEVSDYVSSGEYNNERLKEIFKYIYGEDWDRKEDGSVLSGDERIAYINKLNKQTQQNFGENMLTAWHTVAGGKTLTGENVSPEALAKLEKAGITLNQLSDGSIDFQISDDVDLGEAAHLLSETFEGSEEVWQDLMSYLQVVSPEFQKTSEIREAKTAGKRAAEEVTQVGGKVLLTQEEIDKANKEISEIRDKYGLTEEEIPDYKAQLEASLGKGIEVEVLPTISEENKDELVGIFSKMFSPDGKSLDISGLVSTLKSLGISDVMAEQIAEGVINGVEDGEITQTIDGESFTISKEDALAAIKEAFSYAEEVAQEESVSITFDHGPVDELSNYMDATIGKKNYSINFHPKFNAFGVYAKGTPHAPRTGESLVGEEGPELIETQGGAYLSGLNGPEIFPVNKGDIVHTAQETRKIFRAKGKMMPAFSDGWGATIPGSPSGGKGSGRGGSGSGAGDKDAWENPFDKLYNLVRNIDEELRQRERIERRYEKLLQSIDVSANKIIDISREELAQLEEEKRLQEELIAGRKWQIEQYLKENADLQKYARVEQNERGESVLRIDWDAINAITDSEKGSKIEEYVSQLEEWFDSLKDAEDALWDIEDAVAEIKERGKEQYMDLESMIKDALVESYQREIDKLSEINDSINDTNASLLDAVQRSIDKQRQDRDNRETEEELAEKQRRLAYLQQDTSGANAMEILKLQEEIEKGQQDYTDSLIDQKISELQQQNDEAAKQREQQITLMQAQLDQYVKSGAIWKDVYDLMSTGLDAQGNLITGSELEALLKESATFEGLSEIGKMEWLLEIQRMIAEALAYLQIGRQLEDIGVPAGTEIEFVNENGEVISGMVDEQGNVVGSDGKVYSDVYQGWDGRYYSGSPGVEPEQEEPPEEPAPAPPAPPQKNNPYGKASSQGDLGPGSTGNPVKSIQWALKDMNLYGGQIDGIFGNLTGGAIQKFERDNGITPWTGKFNKKVRDKMRLKGYSTGGLADFTGPAWLDGTKAHPELVLNAKDTQNFIQLKNILGSLMDHPINSSPTENNGDTSFDIDINVENIGSDYDVEQMAAKVKSLINQDARYRNNNAVSLMR